MLLQIYILGKNSQWNCFGNLTNLFVLAMSYAVMHSYKTQRQRLIKQLFRDRVTKECSPLCEEVQVPRQISQMNPSVNSIKKKTDLVRTPYQNKHPVCNFFAFSQQLAEVTHSFFDIYLHPVSKGSNINNLSN